MPLKEGFEGIGKRYSKKFSEAEPFPHIVLDNWCDTVLAYDLLEDLDNSNFDDWDKRDDSDIQVKWRSNWKSDNEVPEETLRAIQDLNSGDFLRFLSDVSGIQGLIPDPYLCGGGFNVINRGGVLAVHADGNWHDLMGLHRRLNVIIYLNEEWEDEWGGQLELWSKTEDNKPDKCVTKISPIFNRMVIFKTDDFSFHGHPTPLNCPEDKCRKSLILYYYTAKRPTEEVMDLDNHHRALFHSPSDIGVDDELR